MADLFVLRHGRSLANEASLIVSSLENGVLPQYALAPAGREQAAEAGRQLAATLLLGRSGSGADADGDGDADADGQGAGASSTPARRVHFYASPFSRTLETAALAAEAFERAQAGSSSPASPAAAPAAAAAALAGPPAHEPALRERFFGSALELQNHAGYSPAWEGDARDPTARPPGDGDGESVADVAARAAELLGRLAERHGGGADGGDGGGEGQAAGAAGAAAASAAAARDVVVLVSHGDTLSILQAAATGAPLREHRRFGLGTAELKRVGPLAEAARRAAQSAAAVAREKEAPVAAAR